MKKTLLLFVCGALVLTGCASSTVVQPTPTPVPPAPVVTVPVATDHLVLDKIAPQAQITSPLTITGKARLWYFEGSFPVNLLDSTGKVIASAPAQAQGEWMTEDWVPFSVTLTFTKPEQGTGMLVFKNDNPSGDPAKDEYVRVPVIF